ncbi:unnamed protein product [Strongylus vulgaris]|uniref:Phosphotransferase n=1 Tax=Strongylus vulgaris TaxID=40348 RepID=A0A3P7KN23_STRVU|nr:unnamed protein product [Strongylus vulgaris]
MGSFFKQVLHNQSRELRMSKKSKRGQEQKREVPNAPGTVSIFDDVLGSITSLFTSNNAENVSNRKKVRPNDDQLEASGDKASLKMLPTYVRAVPNGEENGEFLALDLGGSHFRVLFIKLNGREAEMTGKIYHVPENLRKGSGTTVSAVTQTSMKVQKVGYKD